jgi:hypothetical protein
MTVHRLLAITLIITAACSNHGSSPAPTPSDFFTAQHAWCTVEKGTAKFEDDDKYGEVYTFSKDGTLAVSVVATNEFQQPIYGDDGPKTTVIETHPWHADNQHLIILVGEEEHQSSYQIVKRDVDGKTMNCFTMAEFDTVHCPCAISEAK